MVLGRRSCVRRRAQAPPQSHVGRQPQPRPQQRQDGCSARAAGEQEAQPHRPQVQDIDAFDMETSSWWMPDDRLGEHAQYTVSIRVVD
jgi:hypothetical protein